MSKENIKAILREGVTIPKKVDKDDSQKSNSDNVNNLNNSSGEGGKKEYSDVKRAFEKLGGPSMVDIMKLIGIKDDEKGINRSLFRKKVKQIRNKDTGSYYQFDDKELTQVRTAIGVKK